MCKLEVEKCVSSKKKNVEAQSSKVESKRCHLHIMHATHICINLKCTRRCTQEKLNVEVEAARQQSSKVTMCTQKSRKVEKQQSSKMVESKMGAAARSCSPPTRASDSRHSPTQLLSSSSTASPAFFGSEFNSKLLSLMCFSSYDIIHPFRVTAVVDIPGRLHIYEKLKQSVTLFG